MNKPATKFDNIVSELTNVNAPFANGYAVTFSVGYNVDKHGEISLGIVSPVRVERYSELTGVLLFAGMLDLSPEVQTMAVDLLIEKADSLGACKFDALTYVECDIRDKRE